MKPRVAFVGHHGTTLLFLSVFARLKESGKVDPDPAFITFNPYWRSTIRKYFPTAIVSLFPLSTGWLAARALGRPEQAQDQEGFERGWKLDKILRSRPRNEVEVLWNLTVKTAEGFLEAAKPAVVFSELLQTLPCFALYRACRRRGVPFVQLVSSRVQGRFEYFLDESGIPAGLDDPRDPDDESKRIADEAISAIANKSYRGPAYVQSFFGKRKPLGLSDFRKGLAYVKELLGGGALEPTRPGLLHPITSKLRSFRVARQFADHSHFASVEDVRRIQGNKLLFPLHVTPESSTDLWAPTYNDMLRTARSLLSNLPEGWTLVLKEHPSAIFLQRTPEEAVALRALPRTILVSPFESNEALLAECGSVVVINSTLGWEALIKGFPVITIGRPFYDLSGQTLVCDHPTGLPETLKRAATFRPDPEAVRRFVGAYVRAGDAGAPDNPLLFPYALEDTNVRSLATALERRFFDASFPSGFGEFRQAVSR